MSTSSAPPARSSSGRTHPLGILGAVLHVGIAVWPLSASGLLAPLWAIVLSYLVWLAAAVGLWRMLPHRPALTPLVPLATLAAWAAFIAFGDAVLGWTA